MSLLVWQSLSVLLPWGTMVLMTATQVCHQKIAGPYMGGGVPAIQQFCGLSAYAWCSDCSLYTCDLHLRAMHDDHDTAVEFPKQTITRGSLRGRMLPSD